MLTGECRGHSDGSTEGCTPAAEAYEEKRCTDDEGEDDPEDCTGGETGATAVGGEALRDLLACDGTVHDCRAITVDVEDDVRVLNTCELFCRHSCGDSVNEKNESQGPGQGAIEADSNRHGSLGETTGERERKKGRC